VTLTSKTYTNSDSSDTTETYAATLNSSHDDIWLLEDSFYNSSVDYYGLIDMPDYDGTTYSIVTATEETTNFTFNTNISETQKWTISETFTVPACTEVTYNIMTKKYNLDLPFDATITWSDGSNETINGTYIGYEYGSGYYYIESTSSAIDGCTATTTDTTTTDTTSTDTTTTDTTTTTVLLSIDEPITKIAIAPPKEDIKTYNYVPLVVMLALLIAAIVGYIIYAKKFRKSVFQTDNDYERILLTA
jgi:hypothetical protein